MRFRHIIPPIMGLLIIFFWGGTVLAVTVGAQHPPRTVLAGFNIDCAGQPEPCWHGIVPGVTSLAYALNSLKWIQLPSESGLAQTRYYFDSPTTPEICRIVVNAIDGVISWMTLEYCAKNPLHIGDLIPVLGIPDRILGADHEVGYGGAQTNNYGWWSPFDLTRSVALVAVQEDTQPVLWRGFVPRWRYCQLETETPGC